MTLCCQISSALLGDSGSLPRSSRSPPGFLSDWAFSAASRALYLACGGRAGTSAFPPPPGGARSPSSSGRLVPLGQGRARSSLEEAWAGAEVSSLARQPALFPGGAEALLRELPALAS